MPSRYDDEKNREMIMILAAICLGPCGGAIASAVDMAVRLKDEVFRRFPVAEEE